MSSSTQIAAYGLIFVGLVACKPLPNPGDPLQPVRVTSAAGEPVAEPAEVTGPQGDFDFEGQDRPDGELGGTVDSEMSDEDLLELQARANGLDPSELSKPGPEPEPTAVPIAAPLAPVAIPEWDPTQPLPSGSWGVRLLATLHDVQPPRAVIGLPDGEEIVVQPGTFIEAHRLVVIAVGRDVIQLSKVTPQGFYAKVETQTIQSLFPPAAAN